MLKNQNIICISSIDWDFIWQQHQTIMSTFAREGNRVLFIENTGVRSPVLADAPRLKRRIINWINSTKGFRKERENLYVYSPLVLPFPYLKIARWINKFFMIRTIKNWMKVMDFYNPIIWTFLPTPIVLDLVDAISHKAFIYYCTDNFSATSIGAKKVLKYEKNVLKKADAVFVMARNMVKYCLTYSSNVTCVPMGVDSDVFLDLKLSQDKPSEIKNIRGKVIGFVGGVRSSIDHELVKFLTKRFQDFVFVFVGPIQSDISDLKGIRNIIFTGKKKHTELAAYIKHFDVSIIPYKKDEYTDNISPAKLNEYLIMGSPVVSINLGEVITFNRENGNILYVTDNHEEFASLIERAIKENNDIRIKQRIEVALKSSWNAKIETMSSITENSIEQKKHETSLNWQKRFIETYKIMERKIVKIGTALVLCFLIVFYTPLIWFLAEPLTLYEVPKKSDAIVVFAGGVGESGKAGQGYEERVQYAVELYKEGYVKNMIFSSGYVYTFKEPIVMRALALSLGIPESAIILEDKARNTEENVKFTSEIVRLKGWKSILLVSSPYNMRRAALVFNKVDKDMRVTYVPVKNGLFYSHPLVDKNGKRVWKRINLRQIRGILHEYLGIAYYFVKGRI